MSLQDWVSVLTGPVSALAILIAGMIFTYKKFIPHQEARSDASLKRQEEANEKLRQTFEATVAGIVAESKSARDHNVAVLDRLIDTHEKTSERLEKTIERNTSIIEEHEKKVHDNGFLAIARIENGVQLANGKLDAIKAKVGV